MNRCCSIGQWCPHKGVLVAQTRLRWEDSQVDTFFLLEEACMVVCIVFFGTLEVFLGLSLVALLLVQLTTDEPKLSSVLLGDRIEHVVKDIQSFFVVFLA